MRSVRGFSLIELMVALTIGMILVLALTIVIARASASQRELALANRQVENARYAIQKLTDEVTQRWLPRDACLRSRSFGTPDHLRHNFSELRK